MFGEISVMARSVRKFRLAAGLLCVAAVLIIAIAAYADSTAFLKAKALFESGNIANDEAAVLLARVQSDRSLAPAMRGDAYYYLADYWHRKFYIAQDNLAPPDIENLSKAYMQYEAYIKECDSHPSKVGWWKSDARFNKALVCLKAAQLRLPLRRLNQPALKPDQLAAHARDQLRLIKDYSREDEYIYVRQIIWTPLQSDQINSFVRAHDFAVYAGEIAKTIPVSPSQGDFNRLVQSLSQWCRNNAVKAPARSSIF